MNRRELLTGKQTQKQQRQNFDSVARTTSGLAPYTGTWTMSEVKHLLKRTMFGSTKDDVNYFLGLGIQQSIDTLLELINHPVYTPPSPPLNNYHNLVADPECAFGQPWPGTPDTNNVVFTYSYRRKSLKSWWISHMINQPKSLREKMVLFWSNHFVVELDIVQVGTYVYKYNALLREFSLGNFKEFTKQITINSAMLKYLNGDKNTAAAPNENFARELQELFTVGKDANGSPQYTEDDVKAAARALTGWRNDLLSDGTSANGYNSYFQSNRHDNAAKVFSSWYNNAVIIGQSGSAGANEVDDLMNIIFQRTEVAEFICRKLYRWFVYYEIDSAAEANVIQPLAAIFRSNNYDIVPVLSALFKSEHFFDHLNRSCLIKSPIDFSVAMSREFQVIFPDASNLSGQYAAWDRIRSQSSSMQMDIGDPPNVAGWQSYYQEPAYHELWINTDTLPKRNQFSDRMCVNGYTSYGGTILIDVITFTESMTTPEDPNALIDEVLGLFYAVEITPGLRTYLMSILLSGQTATYYWTNAWLDYVGDPTDTNYLNIVKTRLQSFYMYIMDLSEYQLA